MLFAGAADAAGGAGAARRLEPAARRRRCAPMAAARAQVGDGGSGGWWRWGTCRQTATGSSGRTTTAPQSTPPVLAAVHERWRAPSTWAVARRAVLIKLTLDDSPIFSASTGSRPRSSREAAGARGRRCCWTPTPSSAWRIGGWKALAGGHMHGDGGTVTMGTHTGFQRRRREQLSFHRAPVLYAPKCTGRDIARAELALRAADIALDAGERDLWAHALAAATPGCCAAPTKRACGWGAAGLSRPAGFRGIRRRRRAAAQKLGEPHPRDARAAPAGGGGGRRGGLLTFAKGGVQLGRDLVGPGPQDADIARSAEECSVPILSCRRKPLTSCAPKRKPRTTSAAEAPERWLRPAARGGAAADDDQPADAPASVRRYRASSIERRCWCRRRRRRSTPSPPSDYREPPSTRSCESRGGQKDSAAPDPRVGPRAARSVARWR